MIQQAPLERPTKEQIALLPLFEQLPLSRIHVLKTSTQLEFALERLRDARFIGFDTETKPTFMKEQRSDGPHVIQFATLDHAFIVQVSERPPMAFLREVIESIEIVKVGFGLKSDRAPLHKKLGLRIGAFVELAHVVRRLGYRQAVGVKAAVAILLHRRLPKSRKVTTSNWGTTKLTPRQLEYAASDAHAALSVFHALGRPYELVDAARLNRALNADGQQRRFAPPFRAG